MTLLTKSGMWYFDQVEFKKLQEQVRDVSQNLKNKFRTSAYQVSLLRCGIWNNVC